MVANEAGDLRMKVLLVSQVPPHFETHRKSGQEFPDFQAQTFWLRALKQLGHKTKVFRYSDSVLLPHWLINMIRLWVYNCVPGFYGKYRLAKNRYYKLFVDNWVRQKKLGLVIDGFEPEVILISGGVSDLTATPLLMAKKRGIKIFLIHGVNPDVGATSFEKDNVAVFDLVAVNDPTHVDKWKKLGAKKAVSLPVSGIDPKVHNKKKLMGAEKEEYEADICFVGTLLPERQRAIGKILREGLDIGVWGYIPRGAKLDDELVGIYGGEAWGEKAVRIYNASKIALNLVHESMKAGGNMRTFEIPACGVMQMTNKCESKWYKDGEELVLFNGENEMIKKIDYYLKEDEKRERIARAGYRRTHKQHTYKDRFKKLLALV